MNLMDLVGYQPDFVLYPNKNRNLVEFPEYKPIYVEINQYETQENILMMTTIILEIK